MAKMGRPIIGDKKDHYIGIRITEKQYISLNEYASKNKLTITQTIKKALDLLLREA